ncbi:MAG: hypothetical protein KC503_03760 [Myxococcales bacterium]|nr:hypothetical protein [Myxococcales bacterium]
MRRFRNTLLIALALGALGCSDDTQSTGDGAPGGDGGVKCDPATDPRCQGAAMPTFELQDFQPKSKRFGQAYALTEFKGKVTLVAVLSGW